MDGGILKDGWFVVFKGRVVCGIQRKVSFKGCWTEVFKRWAAVFLYFKGDLVLYSKGSLAVRFKRGWMLYFKRRLVLYFKGCFIVVFNEQCIVVFER